jgi:hypothetical protein
MFKWLLLAHVWVMLIRWGLFRARNVVLRFFRWYSFLWGMLRAIWAPAVSTFLRFLYLKICSTTLIRNRPGLSLVVSYYFIILFDYNFQQRCSHCSIVVVINNLCLFACLIHNCVFRVAHSWLLLKECRWHGFSPRTRYKHSRKSIWETLGKGGILWAEDHFKGRLRFLQLFLIQRARSSFVATWAVTRGSFARWIIHIVRWIIIIV